MTPELATKRLILVVGKGDPYLETALSYLPNVELFGVTPEEYGPATARKDGRPWDLVIFEAALPTTLPDSPILAIAPMVVIGLGSKGVEGWKAVAILAAYLTFFPVAINALRGLQSADPRAFELMESYASSRWSILWRLRVPASLPYLFTALKISATAAVIGAIIGEFMSSYEGLGHAIFKAGSLYIISKVFAALVATIALALVLTSVVGRVERMLMPWRRFD